MLSVNSSVGVVVTPVAVDVIETGLEERADEAGQAVVRVSIRFS